MTKELTTPVRRIVGAAALAVALVVAFGSISTASAQGDLQDQIDALLAEIAQLESQLDGGGSVGTNYTFNANLSQGDSGEAVRQLQIVLNQDAATQVASTGAGSPGNETNYFGSLTHAAVVNFQNKYASEILAPVGLSAGTGYVGPSTRAKLNSMTMVEDDDDDDMDDDDEDEEEEEEDNSLSGGEGFITVDDLSLGAVDIDLGDTETVYELEVEAEDADVEINRVDFEFDKRAWLYFDEVRLMVDGSEVGVLTGSGDYTEVSSGGAWRGRFSGLSEIVREGDTADISLEVVVHSSLSGTRDTETVNVDMNDDSIRFIDGAEIIGYGPENDSDLSAVDVTFDDAFGEGDMDVTINDNSPEDQVFILDETSRTNDQEVLIFDIEAEDGDVNVDEADVVFTNSTGTTTIDNMIRRTRLYADGDLIGTESISGTASTTMTVTFDDLDYDIDEDDVVEFSVEVDFYETDRAAFVVPADLEAELDEVRGEDSDFESIAKSSLGIGDGEVHDVILEGVVAEFNDESTSVNDDGDKGTFDLTFDLTAVGDVFYITDNAANETTTPADGFAYTIEGASTTISNGSESATISSVSGSGVSESGGVIKINKGSTATITLKVVLDLATGDDSGFYGIKLDNYHITTNTDGTTSVTEVDVSGQDIETDDAHLSI